MKKYFVVFNLLLSPVIVAWVIVGILQGLGFWEIALVAVMTTIAVNAGIAFAVGIVGTPGGRL